jgi:hypothetical protein
MWCWVTSTEDGTECVLSATVPKLGPAPVEFQHHTRAGAEQFRDLAEGHSRIWGTQVRLARLIEVEYWSFVKLPAAMVNHVRCSSP